MLWEGERRGQGGVLPLHRRRGLESSYHHFTRALGQRQLSSSFLPAGLSGPLDTLKPAVEAVQGSPTRWHLAAPPFLQSTVNFPLRSCDRCPTWITFSAKLPHLGFRKLARQGPNLDHGCIYAQEEWTLLRISCPDTSTKGSVCDRQRLISLSLPGVFY